MFLCFGGGAWRASNAPSSPQEINLFERAAGLKIGRPQNNSVGINLQRGGRGGGVTPERRSWLLFSHVRSGNVGLLRFVLIFGFVRPFSGALAAVRQDRVSIALSPLATRHAVPPAATFDRM